MATEIGAVKQAVGKPVEVVDDAGSEYVDLRDGSKDIELQEAELRFKNDNNADVVHRMAMRATTGSAGLVELALAGPCGMATESELGLELTDRIEHGRRSVTGGLLRNVQFDRVGSRRSIRLNCLT